MNELHEERVADLIDELMDHPEEQFLSGSMMRTWAERCIEHEEEEWIAMVAFLGVAADLVPAFRPVAELIERRAHRLTSDEAMRALREAVQR